MNRKAQFLTTMQFITAFKTLFVLAIGIIILLYAASTAQVDQKIADDFRNRMSMEQLLMNPQCFAYEDPGNGRVDLGVLDEHKLTAQTLEGCLTYGVRPPHRLMPATAIIDYQDAGKDDEQLNTSKWRGAHRDTLRRTYNVYVRTQQGTKNAKITLMMNPSGMRGETR